MIFRRWSRPMLACACAICAMLLAPAWAAESGSSPEERLIGLAKSPSLSASAMEFEELLKSARAPDAVKALLLARNNPNASLRPAIVACVKRPEASVVQAALRVLPMVDPESDDVALARALIDSNDPLVRASAIECAVDLKDVKAVPLLARCLNDQTARDKAHKALVTLTGKNLGNTERPWIDWHAEHEEKIKLALDAYSDRLRSNDDATVIASIHQLLLLDADVDAKTALISPLIDSPNPDIASTAGIAINKVDPKADVPVQEIIRQPIQPAARAAPTAPSNASTALMRSTSIMALGAVAFGLALIGALVLMVFLLRTKDVIVEATRRLTRRIGKGTVRVGKGAKHWTEKVVKAIKKKITFIK